MDQPKERSAKIELNKHLLFALLGLHEFNGFIENINLDGDYLIINISGEDERLPENFRLTYPLCNIDNSNFQLRNV